MLEEASGQDSGSAAITAQILAKLRVLTGVPEPVKASPAEVVACPAAAAGTSCEWHIRFCPGADLLRSGANPLLLLRELRQLGTLQIKADTAAVPELEELDPERCYLAWDMVLTTAAGADAIRDVFIFVEGNCELQVEPALASSPSPADSDNDDTGNDGNRARRGAGREALQRRPPLLRQGSAGVEHSRGRRQARPAGRSGRPIGDRAGPADRGRGPPRGSRHAGRGRRD